MQAFRQTRERQSFIINCVFCILFLLNFLLLLLLLLYWPATVLHCNLRDISINLNVPHSHSHINIK